MSERGEVDKRNIVVRRLQCQREIHRNRGCAASTLCIDDRKYFPSRPLSPRLALCRRQSHKRLEQVGGGSWPLDELARSTAHGAYDRLRLRHASHGEYGTLR